MPLAECASAHGRAPICDASKPRERLRLVGRSSRGSSVAQTPTARKQRNDRQIQGCCQGQGLLAAQADTTAPHPGRLRCVTRRRSSSAKQQEDLVVRSLDAQQTAPLGLIPEAILELTLGVLLAEVNVDRLPLARLNECV
jgi:hypothetical protein